MRGVKPHQPWCDSCKHAMCDHDSNPQDHSQLKTSAKEKEYVGAEISWETVWVASAEVPVAARQVEALL